MQVSFLKRLRGEQLGLFLTVAIPTVLATLYFAFVASDVYISESQFVVRASDKPTPAGIGNLLQTAGFSKPSDESTSVREYILSRDALRVLVDKLRLDSAYASDHVDRFSRFGGIDLDTSFEALHRYYAKKINVTIDGTSSIVTLTVRAFTAQDAVEANRVLLQQSEDLVNRLNERSRQDLVRYAKAEVAEAERRARSAADALSGYRHAHNVVDPERQATAQLQQVIKLRDELIATRGQLSQLRKFTPDNPQIPTMANRAALLETEIEKEDAKVTGGQTSLAQKAAGFQYLTLEADFASKQLASALVSLENARNEAQRQQVYLERVAQPSLPDSAQEPHRLENIAASILLGFAAWGILSMLIAGLREHQE